VYAFAHSEPVELERSTRAIGSPSVSVTTYPARRSPSTRTSTSNPTTCRAPSSSVLGADGTVSANKATIKIIGEETPLFAQGHFEYDSRKAGSTTVSHLRFGPRPIRSTYRITRAQFIAVHDPEFLERRDVLAAAMPGATVLLNTTLPADSVWDALPREVQARLAEQRCRLFVIDGYGVAERAGLGRRINTVMQICCLSLAKVLPLDEAMKHVKRSVEETWGRRGPEVVERNVAALDATLAALHELPVPAGATTARHRRSAVPFSARDFVQRVTRLLLEGRGDELPVSAFPPDGTWPTGTSKFEKRALALEIPIWQPDVCVQCNFCSMVCPHAAIQTKVFDPKELSRAPASFRSVPETFEPLLTGLRYTVQVAPEAARAVDCASRCAPPRTASTRAVGRSCQSHSPSIGVRRVAALSLRSRAGRAR
jgi:pyruvate-ferredoxin/flavodoxin oxidoreductase